MAGPLKQIHVSPSGVQRCAGSVIEADDSFTAAATTLGTNIYSQGQLRSVLSGHNRAVLGLSYEYPYLVSVGSDDLLLGFHVPREAEVLNRQLRFAPTAVSLRPGAATEGVLASAAEVSTFSLENAESRVLFTDSGCCCVQWHPSQPIVACGFRGSSGSFVRMKDAQSPGDSVDFNPAKKFSSDQARDLGDVSLIRWDPLGQAYFLAAYSAFGVLLWDSTSQQLLKTFPNSSSRSRISSCVWLSSAPGLFVTAGVHSGVLTVWNVSQDAPVGSERVPGVNGVHDLVVKRAGTKKPGISAAAESLGDRGWLAQEDLLVATRDGGVVQFSCAQRTVTWQAPVGHTDTVFDAAFCPDDATILATCSFDSFVRLWSAEDYSCVDSFKMSAPGPNPVCLYTLAWAPGGDGRIATADNNGNAFVVNTRTGAIRSFLGLHPAPVLRLAWSGLRPSWVASTSTNGMALVWDPTTGEVLRKLTHMQPSHGVAWQEAPRGSAATAPPPRLLVGNASGSVMRWDINSADSPQTVKAHSGVVFNVAASPLSPHLVASASNDGNVAVWNTQDDTVMLLRGHTDRVRAITWHCELVHVLITGSWDCTIRVWDTSSGRCLGVCREHRSDVYAVATHPARPDSFVSVSRDSTLRWWTMNRPSAGLRSALLAAAGIHMLQGGGDGPLRAPHYLEAATLQITQLLQDKPCPGMSSVNQALSAACSVAQLTRFALLQGVESGAVAPNGPLFAGNTSRHLAKLLKPDLSDGAFDPLALLGALLSSFAATAASQSLLDAIRAAASPEAGGAAVAKYASLMASSILYPNGEQPVVPQALVSRAAAAAAAEMDVRSCSKHVRIGGPKRRTALQAAAGMYMRIGQVREYCDIQVELGEWEAALAAAPAVSLQYWQALLHKRGDAMAQAPLATREPLMLLIGGSQQVIQQHLEQGTVLLAAALASGGAASEVCLPEVAPAPAAAASLQPIVQSSQGTHDSDGKHGGEEAPSLSTGGLFASQAQQAAAAGKPTLAAAWQLSSGLQGTPNALATLLSANETELAWVLSCAIPAHFSRGSVSDNPVRSTTPRLVDGQLQWIQTSFQADSLVKISPAEDCARRMCMRCFRHGLWGAGVAVLRAAGVSATEISLQAAQIPLTAGIVAFAGKMLSQAGGGPAGGWMDMCNSAAIMSSGMTSDTVGALRQVPPRGDESGDRPAFAPYVPSLSQLLYGKPGHELQQHAQLDAGSAGSETLVTQALRGLGALYTAIGLQPRHCIADSKVYESALSASDPAAAVTMLLRAGEFSLAAKTACVHLSRAWAVGATAWSEAALASMERHVSALTTNDKAAADLTELGFWKLRLHPQMHLIAQVSRLLRYVPTAVLPLELKQACALLAALFGVFDAMSRGFTTVVTPLTRFVVAQDGTSGAQLPVPFHFLRLIQGFYELVIAGDPQKCLIALQRYCATPVEQSTDQLLTVAVRDVTAGATPLEPTADGLHAVFSEINAAACKLALRALPAVKQMVSQLAAAPLRQRSSQVLGTTPVSAVLPGTSTAVNADIAFQQTTAAAADGASQANAEHFSSAVSGAPVRRGGINLEDGFVASEKEALEWALVYPFSPTGSGEWTVPF